MILCHDHVVEGLEIPRVEHDFADLFARCLERHDVEHGRDHRAVDHRYVVDRNVVEIERVQELQPIDENFRSKWIQFPSAGVLQDILS